MAARTFKSVRYTQHAVMIDPNESPDDERESSWGTEPLIEPTYTMNFVWHDHPAAVSGTSTDLFVLINLSNREFNRSLGVWRINYTGSIETKLSGLSVYDTAQLFGARRESRPFKENIKSHMKNAPRVVTSAMELGCRGRLNR